MKRGQGTRHNDPVTSEEGMPPLVVRLARLRSWLGEQPQRFSSALADWADEARFELHEDRALQTGAVREVQPGPLG